MSRRFSFETRDMLPSIIQLDTNEEHCDLSHSSMPRGKTSHYFQDQIESSDLNNVDYMGFIQMIFVFPGKNYFQIS